jgi:hypothetical protein
MLQHQSAVALLRIANIDDLHVSSSLSQPSNAMEIKSLIIFGVVLVATAGVEGDLVWYSKRKQRREEHLDAERRIRVLIARMGSCTS